MPIDYAALKAESAKPAYSGKTDAEIADAINRGTFAGSRDIQWSQVRDIFMSNGDWGTLTYTSMLTSGTFLGGGSFALATRVMAIDIRECCLYGATLKTSDATIRSRVGSRATTLAGATVGAITQASVDAVTALIAVPRTGPEVFGATLDSNDIARAKAS